MFSGVLMVIMAFFGFDAEVEFLGYVAIASLLADMLLEAILNPF